MRRGLKPTQKTPVRTPRAASWFAPKIAQLVKTVRASLHVAWQKYGPSASWYESGILKAKGAYLGGTNTDLGWPGIPGSP